MSAPNRSFRVAKLDVHHTASYNQLSSVPQTQAAHAASLGITTVEASHRLQLLIDEGLVIQAKDAHGKPLDSYVAA
jgi:hypothetical protein